MSVRDPFRFRDGAVRSDMRPVNSVVPAGPDAPSGRGRLRARVPRRVFQMIALESQRSRLPQMAAALSYRTVFGLLPMIIVALVALRVFVSDAQIDQFFAKALSYAGLEAIALEEEAADEGAFFKPAPDNSQAGVATPDPAAPNAPDAPATSVPPIVTDPDRPIVVQGDVSSSELADTIRLLLQRAKTVDYRAIGIIGFLTLIYAAISMLTEIERAFNQIFRVPIGKPWRRRVLEYWALLTLGTPCLVATFFVGEKAKSIVERTVESTGLSSSGVVGIVLSGYAITVLISTALLLLAYIVLPNTRVRVVPALAGALLAAILWEAGKWGFTQYLRYSTSYSKLYGSIALIPLFLLWIYATWMIVLLGIHVTYHIQAARTRKEGGAQPVAWSVPPTGVVDPTAAVAIVHAAARGFLAGKPVSLSSIVETIRVPGAIVTELISRLVHSNLLFRVTVADDPNHVALAQAPERISVRAVLEVGYDAAGPYADEATLSGVRARLRDTHLRAAGSTTISDLLTSSSSPLGPPLAPGPVVTSSIPLLPAPLEPPPLPLAPDSNTYQPPAPPAPPARSPQSETSGQHDANPYPHDPAADTLPLQVDGETQRDQEPPQNGLGDRDPAPRPLRDAGLL